MSAFPAKEPRMDEWASGISGTGLELLSGIAAKQEYRSQGPWMDSAALELLDELAGGSRLGRFGARGRQAELQQLMQAGLATKSGRLTREGEAFVAPMRARTGWISVRASANGRRSRLLLWVSPDGATVAAGPSYHRLMDPDDDAARAIGADGNVQLDHVPAAPAPAGADARFLHAWSQPWAVYQLTLQPGDVSGGMINAGAAGFYRYGKTDGGAGFSPLPSGQLWDLLANSTCRMLAG